MANDDHSQSETFDNLVVGRSEQWQDQIGSYYQICDLRSTHFAKSQALDFVMMNISQ